MRIFPPNLSYNVSINVLIGYIFFRNGCNLLKSKETHDKTAVLENFYLMYMVQVSL